MEPQTVVVKKYGNRRLYDTSGSRYVNLEGIAGMIRAGKQVQVIDAKSGEDLTRVTLTQIITEDAKHTPTGLPLELLRQLIVASDRTRQEFIMWYLKSAFDAYQTVQSKLQSGLTGVQSAAMSPLSVMKGLIQSQLADKPAPGARAEGGIELQQMRERIAELEARIEMAKPPKSPAKRKSKKSSTPRKTRPS